MSDLKTPLNKWHHDHGAKMAPFAGWDMPIQYTGIIQEHNHTRNAASVFDICHMGEFIISGPGATDALDKALTTNIPKIKIGRCSYGFLLTDEGGIIDDLITYKLDDEKYLLVVNAGCRQIDLETLTKRLPASLKLEDLSDQTGKIDLQGPRSREVLQALLPGEWTELSYFGFATGTFQGEKILISRTGYTGEFGYEIYLPVSQVLPMWELLLSSELVEPAGLGARDTLRLEAGLPLNGQDLSPERTPAEAGYSGMLTSEADYAGKAGAFKVREVMTAMTIPGRRSARHGNIVLGPDGQQIGEVTSGSFSPTLGHSIALAYIKKEFSESEKFTIQADRSTLEASRAALPFHNGTARLKI
ncbi:glycine cleavage system aminomethyltransferase GcvT [Desulfovibrio sp. OttesenSCG-928-C06]|nr:glycine cleavage system aminomethyltransferase GcvT [Desulfovibrio sp. OttesenSCG-928-C06]